MQDTLFFNEGLRYSDLEASFDPFEMLERVVEKAKIQQRKHTCEVNIVKYSI
jgi:hypothetical protein